MEISDLITNQPRVAERPAEAARPEEPEESPTRFKGPRGVRWIVFRSRVLDDRFVLVYDKRDLKEARAEHPDKAIYYPPEIEELLKNADDVEAMRSIHLVKKTFSAWIIPSGSPQYKQHTEPRGGCNGKVEHGTRKGGRPRGQRGENPPREHRQ